MITEVINGKKQKCKLAINSGNVSFGNHQTAGVKILPDERKLREYFEVVGFPIRSKKHLQPGEIQFYQNYWVEKELYEKVAPVIDRLGLAKLKGSLLAIMQHAQMELMPMPVKEIKKNAKNAERLKEFFERLESPDFEIIISKFDCINKGQADNFKFDSKWLLGILRDLVLQWKQRNHEYKLLVENGLGIRMKKFDEKSVKLDKFEIYWSVGHFLYHHGNLKSVNDTFKKAGELFSAIGNLPSEKEFWNSKYENETYPSYQDYIADRTRKIITRPPRS